MNIGSTDNDPSTSYSVEQDTDVPVEAMDRMTATYPLMMDHGRSYSIDRNPLGRRVPRIENAKEQEKGDVWMRKIDEVVADQKTIQTPRKKKWSKPPGKPNRPLSAYNLFFRHERAQMLGSDVPSEETEERKKRVHCKTHGKIGFGEMAKAIGSKWKSLEPESKQVFVAQAQLEKQRYAEALEVWRLSLMRKINTDDNTSVQHNAAIPGDFGLDDMANAVATRPPATVPPKSTTVEQETIPNTPSHTDQLRIPRGLSPMPQNRQMVLSDLPRDYLQPLQVQALQTENQNLLVGAARRNTAPSQPPRLDDYSGAETSDNALLNHFQHLLPQQQRQQLIQRMQQQNQHLLFQSQQQQQQPPTQRARSFAAREISGFQPDFLQTAQQELMLLEQQQQQQQQQQQLPLSGPTDVKNHPNAATTQYPSRVQLQQQLSQYQFLQRQLLLQQQQQQQQQQQLQQGQTLPNNTNDFNSNHTSNFNF